MKFDAIVVLGQGLKDSQQHPITNISLDLAKDFYTKGVASRIIVSGGLNPKVKITEASVMKKYLISNGVKGDDVIKEEKSHDTIGNALFTKILILKPRRWRKILVLTSSYHVKRARYIFNKVLGRGYKMKFIAANPKYHRILYRLSGMEKRLFILTKMFFKGVQPGDDRTLKKRIFLIHPLYINKRRLRMLVKMADEQIVKLTNINLKTIKQYKRNPIFVAFILYRFKDFI